MDFENMIYEINKLELPKITPSGTSVFKVQVGLVEVTLLKSEIMQEYYAVCSPDLYEMLLNGFSNLPQLKHEQ